MGEGWRAGRGGKGALAVSLSAGVGEQPRFGLEIGHGTLFLTSQWLHMRWHQVPVLWRI